MTFSIVGYCERTGQVGMAVTSSSVCVASRCAWTRGKVGVVATQNLTDPGLGPLGLDLLERGRAPHEVLDMLRTGDSGRDYRQLQVMDAQGQVAQHTGSSCLPTIAMAHGRHCGAAGNLLANTNIPAAMITAFEAEADLPLAARLLRALRAGLEQGGEVRELYSAGLQVSSDLSWPIVDLRVDGQWRPLDALEGLWKDYEPKMAGYISRASAPQLAVV
ncbi:DUF1028 domain-containing protein [Bordetella sp. N]|uniref:DUF1028 domain-containing protein n=1 Tax=Bordetella sp. N TaxID=1746199 RepID=UPI00070BBE73|nr:DUF1028 domain-containing protein [Bordetella sp. N]ALM85986.1 fimbrial assembly protein FimA [Bordetella sp. N]